MLMSKAETFKVGRELLLRLMFFKIRVKTNSDNQIRADLKNILVNKKNLGRLTV